MDIPVVVDVPGNKINAVDFRVGDVVHDAFGGKHTIKKVVKFSKTIRTYRDDGLRESWDHDETITVVR